MYVQGVRDSRYIINVVTNIGYAGETSNVANENYKLDSCFILNTLSFRVISLILLLP